MNKEQNKMKAELIKVVDIIVEKEEELDQNPMEDVHKMMFVNHVFSQQAAPPQIPAIPNKTIFQAMVISAPEINMELTIIFDH